MQMQGPPEDALQALARLFNEILTTPESRKQFFGDPQGASKSLQLPDTVAEFFRDLSYEELRLLARTWEAMERGQLTYELSERGVRVCFL